MSKLGIKSVIKNFNIFFLLPTELETDRLYYIYVTQDFQTEPNAKLKCKEMGFRLAIARTLATVQVFINTVAAYPRSIYGR